MQNNSVCSSETFDSLCGVTSNGAYNLTAMASCCNYNNAIAAQIMKMAGGCQCILDFGAGQGMIANRFEQPVICVEPDMAASAKISSPHIAVSSIVNLEKGSFDFIYSVNVIEHIENDRKILQQLTSLLKPSGRIFIFVPARQELFSTMDERVGHLRRYSHDQLVRLVAGAGCRVDDCRYFDSLGYLASVGLKLWGKNGWSGTLSANSVSLYDRFIFPISRCLDIALQPIIGKNLILTGTKV